MNDQPIEQTINDLMQQNGELCDQLEQAVDIIKRQHELLIQAGVDFSTGKVKEESLIVMPRGVKR